VFGACSTIGAASAGRVSRLSSRLAGVEGSGGAAAAASAAAGVESGVDGVVDWKRTAVNEAASLPGRAAARGAINAGRN
jgi:hypothetical protein